MRETWRWMHTASLLVGSLALLGVAWLIPVEARVTAWLLGIGILLTLTAIVGRGITGQWRGVLIDDRNRLSLTRLQLMLWSILILSAFLVLAVSNVKFGVASPLAIGVPSSIWLLMGIGTTALVGSPLIRSTKSDQQPQREEVARALSRIETARGLAAKSASQEVRNIGLVIVNESPKSASWSDLFTGEEVGNVARIDLAKVQLFYFTVIVALGYAAALGWRLAQPMAVSAFPELDQGFVTLLGISNAGHLTMNAIPHTKSAE